MKSKITLLFILCTLFISCSKDTDSVMEQESTTTQGDDVRRLDPTANNCYTPVDLIAGQNYTAGIVSYEIIGQDLVVTYSTTGGWEIDATHLYVGDCNAIPTNQPGNPRVGQFPYKSTEPAGTTEVVWTIPTSEFPDCGCIAAHAEVNLDTGNGTQNETAWADGDPLPGNSWAMFFDYCVSDCL